VSDRELGRVCRVTKYLVRKVREDMTAAGKLFGGASAASRDYKPAPDRTAARGAEPPTPPAVPALDAELAVVVERVSAEPAAAPGGQLTSAAGGGGQLTREGGEELGEVEPVRDRFLVTKSRSRSRRTRSGTGPGASCRTT
jgi:hypothetical protein